MAWRIYRLPGSRLIWHVDTGPNTQIVNVRGFQIFTPCYSVDDESKHPRAWIELPVEWNYEEKEIVHRAEMHVIDGVAVWTVKPEMQIVKENPCVAEVAAQSV